MTITRRGWLAATPMLLAPGRLRAQPAWPTSPIRLVVPYAAGGPTDVAARIVAEALSARLDGRVIVENRTGAGTIIGTDTVAKARDGHSFLVATVSHAVNQSVVARLPYDPAKDLRSVALLGTVPLVLLVNRDLPAADLPALLALLRAEPGRHAYGSAGIGSAQHLATELLRFSAGVQIEHVPYRGAAPAVMDLMAGQLTLVIDGMVTGLAHIHSGNVRALAVTSPLRLPQLPDVPAVAETLPGYEAYSWYAVLAPAATPDAVVAVMNTAINATLADPAITTRLADLGVAVRDDSTPASVDRFIAAETAKWSDLLRRAGVQPS